MIFNITSGGVAYISVTAPASTAVITATQGSLSFSRTGSGNITVPALGGWDVTCVYSGVTSTTEHVSLSSYGSTSSNISFVDYYTATIKVTTHPSAYCKATITGKTIDGYANSNGICNLTVPAGYLGTWDVTANNGVITSGAKSVYVSTYGETKPISLLENVPIIIVTSGSSTWTYKGATIDNTTVKITPNGTGWKAWLRASCTVTFSYIPTQVAFWGIGKGGNGGGRFSHQGGAYGGGGGGGGGQVKTATSSVTAGTAYTVTIGTSGSAFGSIISAGNGENGGSPNGGSSGGGSGNGSGGEWVNDHSWPPSSGGGGIGGAGVYAFGESSFDGVAYGHGGGGGEHSGGSGASYSAPGSGGAGQGGSSGVATNGITGIICMRNAS